MAKAKDETQAQRFKRVIDKRMNVILKRMKALQNCFGKGYENTPAQATQICEKLSEAVMAIDEAAKNGSATTKPLFDLTPITGEKKKDE